jgi:hypothetical protein
MRIAIEAMKSNSSGKIMLRALFDPATGKTFVHHPSSESESGWVEASLLRALKRGIPIASSSGAHDVSIQNYSGKRDSTAENVQITLLEKGTRPLLRG